MSQFFYLKCCGSWCPLNSDEAPVETKGSRCCKNFPDVEDSKALKLWLEWYGENDWEPRNYPLAPAATVSKHVGNYMGSCYTRTPWNMQSRALTCARDISHRACSVEDAVPSLNVTLRSLDEQAFVGIVEMFSESMCLFEYRVSGDLPDEFTCAHTDILWTGVNHLGGKTIHRSGGESYKHDASNGASIDKITQVDIELYRAAVLRFVKEMRQVEVETGSRVICQSRFAILEGEVAYIDGLWESVLALLPRNEIHAKSSLTADHLSDSGVNDTTTVKQESAATQDFVYTDSGKILSPKPLKAL